MADSNAKLLEEEEDAEVSAWPSSVSRNYSTRIVLYFVTRGGPSGRKSRFCVERRRSPSRLSKRRDSGEEKEAVRRLYCVSHGEQKLRAKRSQYYHFLGGRYSPLRSSLLDLASDFSLLEETQKSKEIGTHSNINIFYFIYILCFRRTVLGIERLCFSYLSTAFEAIISVEERLRRCIR